MFSAPMSLQVKALSRRDKFWRDHPIMLSRDPKKSKGCCVSQ